MTCGFMISKNQDTQHFKLKASIDVLDSVWADVNLGAILMKALFLNQVFGSMVSPDAVSDKY